MIKGTEVCQAGCNMALGSRAPSVLLNVHEASHNLE